MFNFTYLNTTANIISFIPGDGEAGAYETRINITDGNGNAVYVVINLTIYDNAPPYAPNITLTCYDSNSTYSTPCYYNISQNVTEPNGNSFNFTDNSTFFNINTTTGEINFTGNDSIVGNHTVRINLTDSHGATNFTIVLFEIINVNDAPSLGLKNWTARQTVLFSFDLTNNITDQDTNVSSSIFNESFSFSVVNASNTSQSLMTFFNITVNGTIHIRPNILHIGNYTLNVTVNDSTGASDTQLIYFTIHAYNNPPQFTWVCNNSRQATENNKFTCWLNATDIDSSNLTFQTNTSWFDFNTSAQYINSTLPNASVLANFTPTGSEVGNHSILINVTDDEGAYDEVIFDFEVLSVNNPPTINWWRWISNNPIDMSTTETAFNASENSTIIFRHISSDPDSDSLSYSWVINGTENTTSANHTYWIPFKYTNLSIMNVTLIIDDHRKGYDQQEWNVTIIHVNRPPDLYKNITNQTWPENVDETLNISEYIRDLDGDNLSFNYNLTSDCQSTNCMSISFSGTSGNYVATFTPASNWWGVTNVTIVANDSGYTVNSNSFKLNITYVPRQVRYVTVSSGGGGSGGSSASLVASLSMTIDPFEIITPKEIVRAPVFLENTGEVALNDINLSAEADGFDITLDLADEYFESISPSSNASTYLTINITKAKKDRYEIRMLAFVSSPGLNDSATIYIETTPINKTMVDVRIEFVKDLFEENPECMELMELVFEAEQAIEAENLERAKNLTKLAIDNCRDMIKYGQVTGQLPAQSQPMSIIIEPLHIAVIFIIGISAWYGISRLQRSRWGSKRYRFIPG